MTDEREDRGLRQIGNLLPKIRLMPMPEGSAEETLAISPSTSATTGSPYRRHAASKSIGPLLGALGFDASSNRGIRPLRSTELAGLSPDQVDRLLDHGLPPLAARSLKAVEVEFTDPKYGFDFAVDRYDLTEPIDHETMLETLAIAESVNEGCPADIAAAELARMRALTKSRAEAAEDTEFMVAAFLDELCQYPADIVRDICRTWTRIEKFFPAWTDLREMADRRVRKRRKLLEAVRAAH